MMADRKHSSRNARKCAALNKILVKEELRARVRQVSKILKKTEVNRTDAERQILNQSPEIVQSINNNAHKRKVAKQRLQEVEDEWEMLQSKCKQLATAIRQATSLVIYTGAGISTAAAIPDYRGPNGVWTLLQQGIQPETQDLSDAEPTITHMAIQKLHQEGLVKHVVSQNCDGLHMRSGLPRHALSELHGNMYIELCTNCDPQKEHIRLFDVTERTGVRRHKTTRMCHSCKEELRDTIVHFGEKGGMESPYNWEEAAEAADDADVVLCLGSSLKVLKKYPCLWSMHKSVSKRPKLYIVNLQWTPKDETSTMKINGKCDEVMALVMQGLGYTVPQYVKHLDPIFNLATALLPHELETTSKKMLTLPICQEDKKTDSVSGQTKSLEYKQESCEMLAKVSEDCAQVKCDMHVKGDSEVKHEVTTGGKITMENIIPERTEMSCRLNKTEKTDNEEYEFPPGQPPPAKKYKVLKNLLDKPPVCPTAWAIAGLQWPIAREDNLNGYFYLQNPGLGPQYISNGVQILEEVNSIGYSHTCGQSTDPHVECEVKARDTHRQLSQQNQKGKKLTERNGEIMKACQPSGTLEAAFIGLSCGQQDGNVNTLASTQLHTGNSYRITSSRSCPGVVTTSTATQGYTGILDTYSSPGTSTELQGSSASVSGPAQQFPAIVSALLGNTGSDASSVTQVSPAKDAVHLPTRQQDCVAGSTAQLCGLLPNLPSQVLSGALTQPGAMQGDPKGLSALLLQMVSIQSLVGNAAEPKVSIPSNQLASWTHQAQCDRVSMTRTLAVSPGAKTNIPHNSFSQLSGSPPAQRKTPQEHQLLDKHPLTSVVTRDHDYCTQRKGHPEHNTTNTVQYEDRKHTSPRSRKQKLVYREEYSCVKDHGYCSTADEGRDMDASSPGSIATVEHVNISTSTEQGVKSKDTGNRDMSVADSPKINITNVLKPRVSCAAEESEVSGSACKVVEGSTSTVFSNPAQDNRGSGEIREKEVTTSPTQTTASNKPMVSQPGWFGKGLNVRRNRRKKSK